VKVLDSDHCIALLLGQLDLRSHSPADEPLAVTAVSVGELMHGVYKSGQVQENLARLSVLLASLVVLPYDEQAARRFGRLKAELERAGQRLSDLDLQIASVVIAHRAALVTRNRRHFDRIPDLVLHDWLAG
jgi:tRNA(fMet)-specific endonuclease VapC